MPEGGRGRDPRSPGGPTRRRIVTPRTPRWRNRGRGYLSVVLLAAGKPVVALSPGKVHSPPTVAARVGLTDPSTPQRRLSES